MIMTNERKTASTNFVENQQAQPHLPDATRKRILNSTVKLYVDAFDKNHGFLHASGVIFNVQGNYVQILTAAHNLLVWRGLTQPPEDWAELAKSFQEKLTVNYGPNDMTFNSQPTGKCKADKVEIPPVEIPYNECLSKKKSPCLYDLALITCIDNKLVTYAKGFLGQNYDFQGQLKALLEATKGALKKKDYAYIQLGYGLRSEERSKVMVLDQNTKMLEYVWLNPQTKKYVKVRYNKDNKKWEWFNKGEDKWVPEDKANPKVFMKCEPDIKDMTEYFLHYRGTAPQNESLTGMFDLESKAGEVEAYTKYPYVIELGTNGGTSAKGDSGGPLYAVNRADMTKVYLLGVTTGSDLQTDESPPPPDKLFSNDISTSVIPYYEYLIEAAKAEESEEDI